MDEPEGKLPLTRPRPKWKDNIKLDLQVVVRQVGVDRIYLAQDMDKSLAVVNTAINHGVS
jgi:hypothetical protein